MRQITFTRYSAPYNAGETAGFDEERAKRLVEVDKVARYGAPEEVEPGPDAAPAASEDAPIEPPVEPVVDAPVVEPQVEAPTDDAKAAKAGR